MDGAYEGTVTRYYPYGAQESVRVYERGVLKSSQYWSPDGTEWSAASAKSKAESELKADSKYMAALEDMVARSLAQAHRKIRQ